MFYLKFVSNLVEEKPVIFKIVPIGNPLCDVRPEKYWGKDCHGPGILFFAAQHTYSNSSLRNGLVLEPSGFGGFLLDFTILGPSSVLISLDNRSEIGNQKLLPKMHLLYLI